LEKENKVRPKAGKMKVERGKQNAQKTQGFSYLKAMRRKASLGTPGEVG
jgi:hypothetical protein